MNAQMSLKTKNYPRVLLKVVIASIPTLVAVWSVFSFWLIMYGWPLDRSSLEFSEQNIYSIISARTRDEFLKASSPSLKASLTEEEFNQKIYNLSLLGRITSRTPFSGNATVNLGGPITAKYVANATFEKAQARIAIDLVRDNDAWLMSDLRVTVPVNGEERTLQFSDVKK